jgi:hypothetical protein
MTKAARSFGFGRMERAAFVVYDVDLETVFRLARRRFTVAERCRST